MEASPAVQPPISDVQDTSLPSQQPFLNTEVGLRYRCGWTSSQWGCSGRQKVEASMSGPQINCPAWVWPQTAKRPI
jgi:hypothetical protein